MLELLKSLAQGCNGLKVGVSGSIKGKKIYKETNSVAEREARTCKTRQAQYSGQPGASPMTLGH